MAPVTHHDEIELEQLLCMYLSISCILHTLELDEALL